MLINTPHIGQESINPTHCYFSYISFYSPSTFFFSLPSWKKNILMNFTGPQIATGNVSLIQRPSVPQNIFFKEHAHKTRKKKLWHQLVYLVLFSFSFFFMMFSAEATQKCFLSFLSLHFASYQLTNGWTGVVCLRLTFPLPITHLHATTFLVSLPFVLPNSKVSLCTPLQLLLEVLHDHLHHIRVKIQEKNGPIAFASLCPYFTRCLPVLAYFIPISTFFYVRCIWLLNCSF